MKQKKSRRKASDAAEEESRPAMPGVTPLSYQPLSSHYVERARMNLSALAEQLGPGDAPDERWYVLATDALMLLLGTGCDAARMTWTPAGLSEMRAQIRWLLQEGCVVSAGVPGEA